MRPEELREVLEGFLEALPSSKVTERHKRALRYELDGREHSPSLNEQKEALDDEIEEEAKKILDFLVDVDTYHRAKALLSAKDGALVKTADPLGNVGLRDEYNRAVEEVNRAKASVERQRPDVEDNLERIRLLQKLRERLDQTEP